jgi:hypothetical protein
MATKDKVVTYISKSALHLHSIQKYFERKSILKIVFPQIEFNLCKSKSKSKRLRFIQHD